MAKKPTDELRDVLCCAIDLYRLQECPNLTVGQILESIEHIRHALTEALILRKKIKS